GVAAVAETDVGRHQRKTWLVCVLNSVVVQVEEALGVDIRLPLVHGDLSQIDCASIDGVVEPDRRRQAIDQHVVPLVEDGDSPITIGKTGEGELTIRVALGKGEILAVSIAEAHVALDRKSTRLNSSHVAIS